MHPLGPRSNPILVETGASTAWGLFLEAYMDVFTTAESSILTSLLKKWQARRWLSLHFRLLKSFKHLINQNTLFHSTINFSFGINTLSHTMSKLWPPKSEFIISKKLIASLTPLEILDIIMINKYGIISLVGSKGEKAGKELKFYKNCIL